MRLGDQYHLSYCTNTHAGESWETMFENLKNYLPQVKQKVAPNVPFGFGLWLSNKASEQIQQENQLQEFKDWLTQNNLYVFTMNGFPYGEFHGKVIKEKVHLPDWTSSKRLDYTLRLFDQLAFLLPKGVSGGISTSPLSYKYWLKTEEKTKACFEKASEQLIQVIIHLHTIEQRTGVYMHLDIEPEPDGLIENSDEFIAFFKEYLIPNAIKTLEKKTGKNKEQVKEMVLRYITICYDVCHFSLAYERPSDTLQKLEAIGIQVGKIQISSALKATFTEFNTEEIWSDLQKFNEETYLHQVTTLQNGKVITYSDLPQVFNSKKTFTELRAHFHVPIFFEKYRSLNSTQDQILALFEILKIKKITNHLEVETYTWDVLPNTLKEDLSISISNELLWCIERLNNTF